MLRTKRGFTPFCKGLGIYCNGFWRCGALSPHKCNWSDISHSIKEVEIVEEKIPIPIEGCLAILSCISYRLEYWSRERERECSGYFVCKGSEEKKEERERLRRVRSRNFVTSFTEYNKDKVPMDVATSLVVNHVNIGVLCLFVLCLCLCLWRSYRSKDNT